MSRLFFAIHIVFLLNFEISTIELICGQAPVLSDLGYYRRHASCMQALFHLAVALERYPRRPFVIKVIDGAEYRGNRLQSCYLSYE